MDSNKADLLANTVTLESSDTGKVVVSSDGVAVSGFTLNSDTITATKEGILKLEGNAVKIGYSRLTIARKQ